MVYSGKKLFNGNNAVGVFLALLFGYITFIEPKTSHIGWLMLFITLLITANEAFYFEMTANEFIVKNYILPFVALRYDISTITSIELNSTNYKSTADAAVKIIRDKRRSMNFRASSLGLNEWQNLVNDLASRKITLYVTASRLVDKIGIPEN